MPWVVTVDGRCPTDKPWAVLKQTDGSIVACHPTKDKADAQQKALYANEPGARAMDEQRATWDAAYVNDLPDSAFLYIEPGGTKDENGRTTPRSLRHFPVRDASGAVDMAHLRNALSRIPQSNLPDAVKGQATAKANRMMDEHMGPRAKRWGTDGALYASDFEFRAAGDGNAFSGYAALFDIPSDAPWLPFTETIRPGAFAESLRAKRDHSLVVNHNDDLLLASTRTGRLRLSEDSKGLVVDADLPATSTAADLRALYDVGEVRGMSFSFKPTRGGIRATHQGRELTNVRLGHVTVVTTLTPGYSATAPTVQIRAIADELAVDPEDLEDLWDALRAGTVDRPERDLLRLLANHFDPPTESTTELRSLAAWKSLAKLKGIDFATREHGDEPGAA